MTSAHNIVIESRVLEVGERFVLCKDATVRSIGKEFGISKSTVHKDLTERLKEINKPIYIEARQKLDMNKEERHIRGGEATKQKYLSIRQSR